MSMEENLYSSWIYRSNMYSVSLYVILYYTCKRLCSVLKCFLHSMHQLEISSIFVLLRHSKSAACVISIISNALAVTVSNLYT